MRNVFSRLALIAAIPATLYTTETLIRDVNVITQRKKGTAKNRKLACGFQRENTSALHGS